MGGLSCPRRLTSGSRRTCLTSRRTPLSCAGGKEVAMTVARSLAEFLTQVSYADLPPQTVEHAAMLIASTIASAALGSEIASAAIIRALAMAERTGASGQNVLAAIVLGYEASGRIGEAVTPGFRDRGLHGCLIAIFAAAVATGRPLPVEAERMSHTIALAATSIGGLMAA